MCMTSILTKILEISLKTSRAPCQFFRSKVSQGYGPPAFPFARHLLSVHHPSTGKIRTLKRRLQHSSTLCSPNPCLGKPAQQVVPKPWHKVVSPQNPSQHNYPTAQLSFALVPFCRTFGSFPTTN